MEADKRYVAVQMMLKYKAICCDKKISKHRRRINCTECEFVVKDSMIMRRHMRDVHEITYISTSPPAKGNQQLITLILTSRIWMLKRRRLKI